MDTSPHLTGEVLYDLRGDRIGTISDVVFDDMTGEPAWVVVAYGLFNQHHRLAPIDVIKRRGERVISAVAKADVRKAPMIGTHGVVTPELADEAHRYYLSLTPRDTPRPRPQNVR
jgi:uncharacterized protein YrrD